MRTSTGLIENPQSGASKKVLLVIAAALAFGFSKSSAGAQPYEVTGVAINDVLNLREEPDAGAALVGALSPVASGIEVERRTEQWAFVRFGQQAGWASLRYLQPARSYEGETPPSPLDCAGTEPFWSFEITGERATFRTPEGSADVAAIAAVEAGRNSTLVWLVLLADSPISSAIIEAGQACSDGMSDEIYPLRINVESRDGTLFSGCCKADH